MWKNVSCYFWVPLLAYEGPLLPSHPFPHESYFHGNGWKLFGYSYRIQNLFEILWNYSSNKLLSSMNTYNYFWLFCKTKKICIQKYLFFNKRFFFSEKLLQVFFCKPNNWEIFLSIGLHEVININIVSYSTTLL